MPSDPRPVIEAVILRKEIDHAHCRVFVEIVAVERDAEGNEIACGGVQQFYLDCSQPADVVAWLEQNKADVVRRFEQFRVNARKLAGI